MPSCLAERSRSSLRTIAKMRPLNQDRRASLSASLSFDFSLLAIEQCNLPLQLPIRYLASCDVTAMSPAALCPGVTGRWKGAGVTS